MTGRPADFSRPTRRVIASRAGWRCSAPACGKSTVGPGDGPDSISETGVAAHIYAASPSGPRGTSDLSLARRTSPENGIWLCASHGRLVDSQDGRGYSAGLLIAWRDLHESRIALELGGNAERFHWVERLTIEEGPLNAGLEIVFGRCTLIHGANASGKSSLFDFIESPTNVGQFVQWARRTPVRISIRSQRPEPTEMTCSASADGGFDFVADGIAMPVPIAPYQTVRVRVPHSTSQIGIANIADLLNVDRHLVPNLVRFAASAAGSVAGRSKFDAHGVLTVNSSRGWFEPSGSQIARLLIELSIEIATAKAFHSPTLLLVDDAFAYLDRKNTELLSASLQQASRKFQSVIATHRQDSGFLNQIWEVVELESPKTTHTAERQ